MRVCPDPTLSQLPQTQTVRSQHLQPHMSTGKSHAFTSFSYSVHLNYYMELFAPVQVIIKSSSSIYLENISRSGSRLPKSSPPGPPLGRVLCPTRQKERGITGESDVYTVGQETWLEGWIWTPLIWIRC